MGERILDAFGTKSAAAYADVLDGTLAPSACHSPIWPMRFLFINPLMIRIMNRLIGMRAMLRDAAPVRMPAAYAASKASTTSP
jgi:hypothetical protein